MGCGVSTQQAEFQKENVVEVERIDLTESIAGEYVQLENEIRKLDKDVWRKYEMKSWYAIELKKNVDQLEATYKELKKQTDKEKADVDNLQQPPVRAFLKKQGTYDQKFNKAHKRFMELSQKQEAAHKELQRAVDQYEKAAEITEHYKQKCDVLSELYDRQERLIAGIFDGIYGSDLEYRLELQLDEALEWQQRVALAKFKWTNARVLLVHASAQFTFGIKRWKELETIQLSNTRLRYFSAAEARNNFIAAGQNVRSCRVYLGTVQFPYCSEKQMDHLEQCINQVFSDFQVKDKCRRALRVYEGTYKEVAALIQWFDQVVNETIFRDLEQANNEVSRLRQELRLERLRLMQDKVVEKLGRDIRIDNEQSEREDDADQTDCTTVGKSATHEEAEKLADAWPSLATWSPMPPGQLAPVPSTDSLFGNIDDLKRQHEKERKEMERQQEAARAKMDQGLRQKLQQRRRRKELLQVFSSELPMPSYE